MSSYIAQAKNKDTGEIVEVVAMDDYFGNHRYGYSINGKILTQDVFDSRYEWVKEPTPKKTEVTPDIVEDTIKNVTNKFLGWKLPDDFNPDGGISYEPDVCETFGTHLFSAQQAESMFSFLLKDELENIHQQYFKDGEKKGIETCIKLSDEIELREPDGGTKQWMAFKRFRNTMRDALKDK